MRCFLDRYGLRPGSWWELASKGDNGTVRLGLRPGVAREGTSIDEVGCSKGQPGHDRHCSLACDARR